MSRAITSALSLLRSPAATSIRNRCLLRNSLPLPRAFSAWASAEVGVPETTDYRMFTTEGQKRISPWHHIPLFSGEYFNYVNEIPRGTKAKMEIATKEENNPIKQDIKKGKLRYFTYGTIPFNYGALPQTWENPHEKDSEIGLKGDNDPLDVIEISTLPLATGKVTPVKILGCLALIDEDETDWKIIAVAQSSPLFYINTIPELEKAVPGLVNTIKDWFINYKTTDGKPKNKIAMNENVQDTAYSLEVVAKAHKSWQDLISGASPADGLWLPPPRVL